SDVQLYTAPNPWGTRELRRRRYTQTLGLIVADLVGRANEGGPDLTWSSRLRLDADLGQGNAVTDPTRGSEFVPGVSPAPVDLQYAYLDARGLVGEALAFRVGRQYVTGPLGWWSFDGARVT